MHGMPSEELEFAIGLEKCAVQEPKFAALYFVAAKDQFLVDSLKR